MEDSRVQQARVALRITFGAVPIVAGLDKFLNILTQWEQYLSPLAKAALPMSDVAFMHVVGIIEIAVGLMVLTKWTRIGAYVASVWLVLIALNLVTTGHYFDIAARDVGLAVGAFALARLQEVRERSRTEASRHDVPNYGSPAHG